MLMLTDTMAAVIILLAMAVVVATAAIYSLSRSNRKLKPWLHSILRRAAFLPIPAEGFAASVEDEKNNKNNRGVVAVAAAGRAALERAFATFDRDGDGYITFAELEESLRKLRLFTSREEVAHMVEKLDANGDGLLDLEEFRELYNSVAGGTAAEEEESEGGGGRRIRVEREGEVEEGERDLKEAFDVFDGNGDGLITAEELGMVLAALGLAPGATAARCCDMIKKVDMDGDGMVSFEEFKQMMKGTHGGREGSSEPSFF